MGRTASVPAEVDPVRPPLAIVAAAALALASAGTAAARSHYVGRPGDTLTGIAHAHATTLTRLARVNHRRPYALLRIGTVLVVPGHTRRRHYTVRWGDTLTGIAARHHVGLRALERANRLGPGGVLLAGTRLRIPSGHAGAGGAAGGRLHGRYRVQPGDTLSGIGVRFGIGVHR